MNLISGNNLLDVYDIDIARNNFTTGDFVYQNIEKVYITGGRIEKTNVYINTNNVEHNMFLNINPRGEIVFDTHKTVPHWYDFYLSNIDMYIFNNDISLVSSCNVHDIVYDGNYNTLQNKPKLKDYHNVNQYMLATFENVQNLAAVYENLDLSPYMQLDYHANMIIDNIKIRNLNLVGYDSGLVIHTNKLNVVKQLNLQDNEYVKIKNYSSIQHNYELPTSASFKEQVDYLYELFSINSTVYARMVSIVLGFMADYMDNFLKSDNLLSDIYDSNYALTVLGLDNIQKISFDNQSFSNVILDIIVESYGSFKFMKPTSANIKNETQCNIEQIEQSFYYIHITETGEYQFSQFIEKSTFTEYGIVMSTNDVNNQDVMIPTYNAMSNLMFSELQYIQQLKFICDIEFFEERSNLLAFSSNLYEIKDRMDIIVVRNSVYSNLGIHPVAYTSNYNNLVSVPESLNLFINDELFLSDLRSLAELINLETCRQNLDINSFATQNTDGVDISGNTLNLNLLSIHSEFMIYDNTTENKVFTYPGQWQLFTNYENTNSSNYGFVKMFTLTDNFNIDMLAVNDHDCYSLAILKNIYDELEGKIQRIESKRA